MHDLNLSLSPEETGNTFEENSKIKAVETAEFLRLHGYLDAIVLADDSGLAIDAMDGRPGVDSALFLGADTPHGQRNAFIINELHGKPPGERTAYFVCVITCCWPSGEVLTVRGELEGLIAQAAKGENGFGYDPIFYVPTLDKNMAELSQEEKNKISHRGQAVREMIKKLKGK